MVFVENLIEMDDDWGYPATNPIPNIWGLHIFDGWHIEDVPELDGSFAEKK